MKNKNMLTEWRQFLKEQKRKDSEISSNHPHEKRRWDWEYFPDGGALPKGTSSGTVEEKWKQLDRLADIIGIGPRNRILQLGKTFIERYKHWESHPKVKARIDHQLERYKNFSPEEKKRFDDWAKNRKRW